MLSFITQARTKSPNNVTSVIINSISTNSAVANMAFKYDIILCISAIVKIGFIIL